MKKAGKKQFVPTVEQISSDRIFQIARKHWSAVEDVKFDESAVDVIYEHELVQSGFSPRRIMHLEFSRYLEKYLWPYFDAEKSNFQHVISIAVLVNEKFRERIPAWECFAANDAQFSGFFHRIMDILLSSDVPLPQQTQCLIFLTNCVSSLEIDLVRKQLMKLVSLPIWHNLYPKDLLGKLLVKNAHLKKYWRAVEKKEASMSEDELKVARAEQNFFKNLISKVLSIIFSVNAEGQADMEAIRFCERFLELAIEIESIFTGRRFFNSLLKCSQLVCAGLYSPLAQRPEGQLFKKLLLMLEFYERFEINDFTGEALTEKDTSDIHYTEVLDLQKAAFKNFRESMKDFYLLNVGSVDSRQFLTKKFGVLNQEQLLDVAVCLGICDRTNLHDQQMPISREYLLELLIHKHEKRLSQLEKLNESPLYPTEKMIWDEDIVPDQFYSGEDCLALNKLNLQFLTLHDYLLRNFTLFQLESTYEIRKDLEDVLFRMKPWVHESGEGAVFGGWARMALQLTAFSIVEVSKPNIGDKSPSSIRADFTVSLPKRNDIRREWEGLRKHDVCFLVAVRPRQAVGTKYDIRRSFTDQIEVAYVRGCEIEGMLGPDGKVIEEFGTEPKPLIPGDSRSFRVWLDCNQYRIDMEKNVQGGEDVYDTFQVVVRRNPKENNFKAVLETMRQLMNTKCVVPDWLSDIILGYGEPSSAHYSNMKNRIAKVDFNDTFLDFEHLKDSFPHAVIRTTTPDEDTLVPPFQLTFGDLKQGSRKRQHDQEQSLTGDDFKGITVEPRKVLSRGPYPYTEPKKNAIRFTPTQVEAIKSGMQPGLTMIVGPPGTGKTDVAVQIINNIYHNWPEQRTLIVTHSNQALNQLFEKIMKLDIDERHLLRLGHGEEALETEKDFSRYGRVNYVLAQRLELLKEVERFQKSLGVQGDVSYTCETAGHFFLYQVYARWEEFLKKVQRQTKGDIPRPEVVEATFPFMEFFSNAPQPLFKGVSYEEDLEIAEGCWRHIQGVFQQLEEFRAFELLRTGRDRTEYLLVKEAKIIAMTCTHSALRRKDLVELGFRYDNILMEESAQILEIETFIPLLLQNPQDGHSRLKRWIMIGDHHQLPPVIQNMAFQKYANMEQSLFARFVRLGVPVIQLDAQGRARSSIASLYSWRYKKLGDLPHVEAQLEYQKANTGFLYDYQLIDVQNFNGVGESTPSPYFYQNLAEAEYAVAIFMYMRLLGYPGEKISILTTYNGQKHLIRDVVKQRCSDNPMIGNPHKITTVDKYQGQQNDYIILSLVRTVTVGHLRDVRRLIVAMSRARLGLYVLARASLFSDCFELTPAFNRLRNRPHNLMLLPHERFPTQRRQEEKPGGEILEIQNMPHMAEFVFNFYSQSVQDMRDAYEAQQREMETKQAEAVPYADGQVELEREISEDRATEDRGSKTGKDIEFEVIEDEQAKES